MMGCPYMRPQVEKSMGFPDQRSCPLFETASHVTTSKRQAHKYQTKPDVFVMQVVNKHDRQEFGFLPRL